MSFKKSFLMVALMIILFAPSASHSAAWDGTVNTSWYDAAKTAFTITTPAQLAGLAELVNSGDNDKGITFDGKTITLANDIDLASKDWRPIGFYVGYSGSNRAFSGTFDGGGHDIVNLFISGDVGSYGFFVLVSGDTSTVKNVNVSGSVLKTGTTVASLYTETIGGVVAHNYGIVENCSFSGRIHSPVRGNAGGIVGRNVGRTTDCSNYGSIYGDYVVGGVIGWSSQYSIVINCSNFGSVEGTGWTTGGVIGLHSGTAENCLNAGDVVGDGSSAGGIIGFNEAGVATNCYNMGNISTTSKISWGGRSSGWAGGIVGEGAGLSITNSSNTGAVSGYEVAGGILGGGNSNIKNCSNTGKIITVTSSQKLGGLVGYNSNGRVSNSEYAERTADRAIGENSGGIISPDVVSIDLKDINIVGVIVRPSNFKIDGDTVKLTAFVHPERAEASKRTVTWKSNNASIASVTADGTVSGNNTGKTKITVTTDKIVLGGFIDSADASAEVIKASPKPPVPPVGGGGGGCSAGYAACALLLAVPMFIDRKKK